MLSFSSLFLQYPNLHPLNGLDSLYYLIHPSLPQALQAPHTLAHLINFLRHFLSLLNLPSLVQSQSESDQRVQTHASLVQPDVNDQKTPNSRVRPRPLADESLHSREDTQGDRELMTQWKNATSIG